VGLVLTKRRLPNRLCNAFAYRRRSGFPARPIHPRFIASGKLRSGWDARPTNALQSPQPCLVLQPGPGSSGVAATPLCRWSQRTRQAWAGTFPLRGLIPILTKQLLPLPHRATETTIANASRLHVARATGELEPITRAPGIGSDDDTNGTHRQHPTTAGAD